jgi:hypothetical protein
MPDLLGPVAAIVLLAAAALKAADRAGATAALATYGLGGASATAAWGATIALEAVVAIGVLAGWAAAAWVGAGLMAAFAVLQAVVLARGGGGAPCGCFGARGGLSISSLARTLALGGAFAIAAAAGAGASAWWLVPAGVAVIAVVLTERAGLLAPRGALVVAGEGPDEGARVELPGAGAGGTVVAAFTSPGCRLCRRLRPALEALASELEVRVYDEHADAAAWEAVNAPGAPFVVVLHDGVVRAKGTANTRAQLHSLLGAAERSRLEEQAGPLAEETPTRRTLLAQAAGLAAAAVGAHALIRPGEAEAYHFCGHIYTTDSCPHPTGLPRINAKGFPLRARDGRPVDDLGRRIGPDGRPVDEDGLLMTDAEGRPLPRAPRTRVCTAAGRRYGFKPHVDGAWYRCCKGRVRKLVDCCTPGTRRINGDRALHGYCYRRRRVFCVMYFDTKIPCDNNRDRRVPRPS